LESQNIFKEKYDSFANGLDSIKKRLYIVKDERNKKNMRQIKIPQFIEALKQTKIMQEFNESTWLTMSDFLKVQSSTKFTIIFRSGLEIEVDINNNKKNSYSKSNAETVY
jgi:hypothetical protein